QVQRPRPYDDGEVAADTGRLALGHLDERDALQALGAEQQGIRGQGHSVEHDDDVRGVGQWGRVRVEARASGQPGRQQLLGLPRVAPDQADRKSTRLNSSHVKISYAVFCLKKKKKFDNAYKIE